MIMPLGKGTMARSRALIEQGVGCANPSVMLLGVFVDESAESVASVELVWRVRVDEA